MQFVSHCLQETFQLQKPSSVCESGNFKLDLLASRCKKCANKEGRDEDPRGLAKRASKAHKGAVQQLGDVSALIIQNMVLQNFNVGNTKMVYRFILLPFSESTPLVSSYQI